MLRLWGNTWSCFAALAGGVNLGKRGLKIRQTVVSRNRQLYSEHQTVSTLRVTKNGLSKMYNHKDKTHVTKTCFCLEGREQQQLK